MGEHLSEHSLASVTKGRMAQVMGKRDRFGEVLVEAQAPREGARNLGSLECMGQTVPVMVSFMVDEDLGLVLEAPESA